MYFHVIAHSGHFVGTSFRSGILGMPFIPRRMGMIQCNLINQVVFLLRNPFYLLSKPHPFPFLAAKGKNHTDNENKSHGFVVVGDSTSDILGGRAAGAITVAVMTGARTFEARTLLAQSNPDFTIEDVTKLPDLLEHLDSLVTIQHMQFQEREKAELLLQRWLARHMNVLAESVTLTPKAVSLNSFNGFYRSDGEEYFFKTHIEEQGILEEYS